MRIGQSTDVHPLAAGRALVLGGVHIPCDKGTLGHSDGDALTHAVTEAIIGAMALGDIGSWFPDNDPRYEGISSLLLLKKIGQVMREHEYEISNIDALILIEKPKMRPYIEQMRKNLADTLGIDIQQVNVKATTYEKMGPIGQGQAVEAQAVVLLKEKGEF